MREIERGTERGDGEWKCYHVLASGVVEAAGPVPQDAHVQGALLLGGVGGQAEGVPLVQRQGRYAQEDVLPRIVPHVSLVEDHADHVAR